MEGFRGARQALLLKHLQVFGKGELRVLQTSPVIHHSLAHAVLIQTDLAAYKVIGCLGLDAKSPESFWGEVLDVGCHDDICPAGNGRREYMDVVRIGKAE